PPTPTGYQRRSGTSIWYTLIGGTHRTTASQETGASGTRTSSICEGRCVKTMVLSRPIRSASQPAKRSESPESTPTQKKRTASVAGSKPQRRKNQYATIDCTTNPPAKESRP